MATRKPTAIVGLKVRLREPLRKKLEVAAKKKGVSLNAELVSRLEMALIAEHSLILAYGGYWLPVIGRKGGFVVGLPLTYDEYGIDDEHMVELNIDEDDKDRLRNFFTGAPPPYDQSWHEIEETRELAIAEQEHAAKRGRKK